MLQAYRPTGMSREVRHASVAQSVEHHHGKVGVSGSNPLGGSFFFLPVRRVVFYGASRRGVMSMANAKKKGPVEKIALQ